MAAQKPCMLTLKLSSPSFLDSTVSDDHGTSALYTIRTNGATTIVSRSGPQDESTDVCTVQWPPTNQKSKGKGKALDGLSLQVRGGPWEAGETLLRQKSLRNSASPRKFNIPGYSRTLKWKVVGDRYCCMSPSVPGPVATLDTAVGSIPPRLKVYETFRDSDDTLTAHHGVSVLLLDYLLVTALLLVADPNEYSSENASCSPSRSWKKLIPKDTIFGRRSSSSNHHSALEFSGSISLDQMSKIVYGDPIYPTLSLTTPEPASATATESGNDDGHSVPSSSRPSSPACSSAACPSTGQADSSHSRTSSTPPIAALPTLQTAPARTPSPEELESSPTSLRAPSLSSYSLRRLPAPPQVPPPSRPSVRTVPSISPIAPPPLEPPRPLYIQTHRRPHTSAGSTEYSSASPSPSSTRRLPIPPTVSVHGHRHARRKESTDDLGEWMSAPRPANDVGMSVVDFPPPPAYNTIDFALPEDPPMRPLPQAPLQQ
ncbi:hypothetical protein CYLTODRAFT_492776 [Cylindrobasidium torrendii FP15055 ss-10]|uniref:Uncharacterized protein n=1 Tax=Cylindrobasidium torrendii FP15055 ss-10 TaxID=1314674 RepID=A0A0D7B5S4_9AGAR|nr:hypothetical protein CYLTODRAFT_492776 [Cylindrobasidium torrendii FP15055 ss-10]